MKKRYLLPGLFLSSHAVAQSPPAIDNLPQGGHVIAGEAAIDQIDSTLRIHQWGDRAAIDWESFDVGSRATVEFLQPSTSAVTLNRVTGSNASQIFGRISANGQVFLSNPNGVYFAPGASVDVGGLVATTHSISVEDFMAGSVKFERNGATGSVINEGELTAALSGYIALLAPEVRNDGLILANLGTVALAAGETFELQFGSDNTIANLRVTPSTIQALVENRSAVLAPGGLIILSAQAVDRIQGGVISNSGVLEATGLAQRGGRIVLEGDDITLASGSIIDASGDTGGGEVLVGGDWQGSGDLHQAARVHMAEGALIHVSAMEQGDGGKAVLWADVTNPNSLTTAHGQILARGGADGGNGGQIETSAYALDTSGIIVDAGAPRGVGGLWLIDPSDTTITQSVANGYRDTLNTGTSVLNDVAGSITWGSGVTLNKTAGGEATLTLRAGGAGDIDLNGATIGSSSGALNLVLWTRYNGLGNSGRVSLLNSSINTNGGHFWIGGGNATTWNGLTVGDDRAATWIADQQGIVLRGSSIITGAGSISMAGLSYPTGGGNGGVRNFGVLIDSGSSLTTTSGSIRLDGEVRGRYANGTGLFIGSDPSAPVAGNVSITSGAGAITITGAGYDQSGSGNGWRHGVVLSSTQAGDNVSIRSGSGAITVTGNAAFGSGGDFTTDTSGLQLQSAGSLQVVSTSGAITLRGSSTQQASQYENALRFAAADTANAIRIGYDGAAIYSGNILIEGDSILQRLENAGAGSLAVQSTGSLIIAPVGASFTAFRAGNSGTLTFDDDWNFGSTLGGFTLGKSGNTANLALSNALTTAGPISLYGGDITLNSDFTTTASGAAILFNARGNITTPNVARTITTNNGNVTMWGDSDANGSGHIDLDYLTINPGSGNVTFRGETAGWSATPNPAINGTGIFTFESSDASFSGTAETGWFTLASTLTGVNIGKSTNTADVSVNSAISVAGPVTMYGGAVNVQQNLSAGGAITLRASGTDVVLDGAITNTASSATALTIEAARHIRVGSDASITSSTAAMTTQLRADTNSDGDGIVYLTSSGINTQGGSLTFGQNGQTANIGGASVRVGGDVFFQRGSAQTLSTGGGALNVYGETIVANTSGLTINTNNGAVNFYGLLNSGNAYTYVDKTGSAASGSWDAARTEARNGTAGGSAVGDSYLTAITSRLENSIAGVTANYRGSWIGAYRPDSNSYNWAWADGPEAGQIFFTQTNGGGGAATTGYYSNFGAGEPNGGLSATRSSVETVGQFFGSAGAWNDLTHNTFYAASQTSQYAVVGFVRETNLAASPVTINAGTGAVTLQGGVGASKALASFNVTSSGTTMIGNGLVTTGAQTYSSGLTANAGSGNLLLQGSSITAGGAVTATGADITLDATLTSTASGAAMLAKASGNITTTASRTLQTNNGNLTLWSDSDGNGAGQIALGNNNALNSANGATAQASGGGRITLAGGTAVDGAGLPTGSAASTTVHGVSLGATSANTTSIYSGGGDVLINGATTTTSSAGDGAFHGVAGWGAITLNAGQGAITMTGASTDSYGLTLSRGGTGASTLSSAKASGTAISLTGTTTAAESHGLVLDNSATEDIMATGGGAIAINGTGTGANYGVWLQGSRLLASSGAIGVNGGAGGINAAGSGNVLGKYSSGVTTSSSNITLTGNRVSLAGATAIDGSGALTVQPFGSSFSSTLTWPLSNLTLASSVSGLTLGKVGNTANITVGSAQSIAGPINIYGGDITINAGLEAAGANTITLQGSGNVTDGASGYVSALNLRLLGGNVTLDNANNGVGYLAASGVGDLTYIDSNTLVIDAIGGTAGVSATGVVNIGTLTGDLSLLNNVSTTNTTSSAVRINAGINASAGMATGGSLFVFNNSTVSVGAGGRATLFTGSVADSGLGVLVGSGTNRFRYNSDEATTNYTLALGSGL